jgi:hypothetical protein
LKQAQGGIERQAPPDHDSAENSEKTGSTDKKARASRKEVKKEGERTATADSLLFLPFAAPVVPPPVTPLVSEVNAGGDGESLNGSGTLSFSGEPESAIQSPVSDPQKSDAPSEGASKELEKQSGAADIQDALRALEPSLEEVQSGEFVQGSAGELDSGDTSEERGGVDREKFAGRNSGAGFAELGVQDPAKVSASVVTPVAGATATGSSFDGTWSAQQESTVKLLEQDTPSPETKKGIGASHSSQSERSSVSLDATSAFSLHDAASVTPDMRMEDGSSVSPVRVLREGLMEGLLDHAAVVKNSGLDTLGVSIRADAQTEISVRFSYVDGVVHAHAQCERGDYGLLNTLWHDLQLNLSKQGVSLSALLPPGEGAQMVSGNGTGGMNLNQGRDETLWTRPEEPSMAPTFGTMPRASVGSWLKSHSRRLFESWA